MWPAQPAVEPGSHCGRGAAGVLRGLSVLGRERWLPMQQNFSCSRSGFSALEESLSCAYARRQIKTEISKKDKILALKKRTIGQVNFEESIYLTSLNQDCEINRYNMEWIKWENLNEITLSGPHRKWIEELKLKNSK